MHRHRECSSRHLRSSRARDMSIDAESMAERVQAAAAIIQAVFLSSLSTANS